MKTPPGQMSGPVWKAVPSVEAVDAHERGGGGGGGGGEVPPKYCIFWMGAQNPEAPLRYQ